MRKHPLLAFATAVLILSVFGSFVRSRPAIGTTTPHQTPSADAATTVANSALLASAPAARGSARLILVFRMGTPLDAPLLSAHGALTGHASATWQALRACESGGNYRANTGNGFFGAYQFAAQTWWAMGEHGMPDNAPPREQDAAAEQLVERVGWRAWPTCSAVLGLR